jgi:hypothetical protein
LPKVFKKQAVEA